MVFVTMGTTCFDALVKAVDTWEVKQELSDRGYTDLVIQMGCESYTPTKSGGEDGSLAVDFFTFSSSIADYLRSASLLISHTGLLGTKPRSLYFFYYSFWFLAGERIVNLYILELLTF
ncbi:UDP-N-acetylglucosamine transferase subunit alg13-like isoform X1 [Quercus robur]|uniref:UDP-N-acetylglucosamine transferase subunit alg13-like isoform X1 n=1 Tax=Quercus robur TaxID=38942 RepID=UPI0021634398|nr:UDP-N-acetylglucosamine transferase subunit alg13-like isoform X1 [Quercus robur]XP_050245411.1 UDP-N-acetylglucosamine transferase subunit alg13-like isoform X1 [Quercus robur]XP_050245412.1 UDP-N-acetylglucosamine transferase subunit alg13-like isoform X1 [Quercus robur]